MWLSLGAIPALSVALLGPRRPLDDIMTNSTGKNSVSVDRDTVQHALWCYGLRFFPTSVMLILAHGLAAMEDVTNHHLNTSVTALYLVAISVSFLFRSKQISRNHLLFNPFWKCVIIVLGGFELFRASMVFSNVLMPDSGRPNWHYHGLWVCFLPLVIGFNEAIKRCEIKGEVRFQKRQRLEFGTKLGINSPF